MRNIFLTVAMIAPIAITGCKKKTEVEPAPAAAPVEPVTYSWGTIEYAGSHAEGQVGTLKIPLSIVNNTERGLIVSAVDVGVTTDSGRICRAASDQMHKAMPGTSIDLNLESDCAFTKLPMGNQLPIKGSISLSIGGVDEKKDIDTKVMFNN